MKMKSVLTKDGWCIQDMDMLAISPEPEYLRAFVQATRKKPKGGWVRLTWHTHYMADEYIKRCIDAELQDVEEKKAKGVIIT